MITSKDSLQGKAIVVGANGGMGKAVALALAHQGVELALIGRNEKAITAIAETCNEAGATTFPLVCDIAKNEPI